jgi:hypothetical protein
MIPRYFFPIKTGHLPGPYIIYGIHNGKYSEVTVYHEFPGYLIMFANESENSYGILIYEKSSGDLFNLAKYMLPPPYQFRQPQFINDIDGIINPPQLSGRMGRDGNMDRELMAYAREITELKSLLEKDSLGFNEPKLPEKRTEFIRLINSSKIDDNPILQVFHLKR